MAYPAHMDALIDFLVEAVLRDLENENAPVAVLAGQATEARRTVEEYPTPAS